jgi:N-acetylglucosaminyl-diphospho-decaprenol L-rhamnosyltransferase
MISLATIIISFNTRDLLAQTLRSFYEAVAGWGEPYHVIVVDNASSDESAAMVARDFPQVELLLPGENLGFARGNNLAMRHLGFEQGKIGNAEFVWLLNSDTEVIGDAPQKMVAHLRQQPQVGVVGPRLQYGDGSFQHGAFALPGLAQVAGDLFPLPGRFYESRLNGRYPQSLWKGREAFEVGMVLGAAMMVRGATITDTGMFDEGYFMYVEEVDWCRRIQDAGWQIHALPTAHVIHHSGKSTGQFRDKMFVALWRSRLRYYDKWASPLYRRIVRDLVRTGIQQQIRRLQEESPTPDLSNRITAYREVATL